MDKQYSGQDVLSAFQLPRKPIARPEGYTMADFESPYLQPVFETATALTVEQAARNWGSKTAISQSLEQLTHAAMPQLGGKKTTAMTAAEKAAFNKMWISIRGQLIDKRRQLVAGGLVPPLGGAAVPFGFRTAKYGSHSGLAVDTTYLKSPRLDTTLANLQQQGKINITQDQLDIFQRVANVETSGGIQTLNTYDSAVVSIGFFQFTLHVGKLQAWINLAPEAFKKFGIELDATLKYKFGENGSHPAIKGVPDGRRNELRWNGWAERFYYAGLNPDVIAAQVTLALKYLAKHLSDLKARLKNKTVYDTFYRFYSQNAYVRGLFQASHNNNPARSTRSVKAAVAKAGNGDVADFLEEYKNIMTASGWERLVRETARGATAIVRGNENELYEDYIAADIPEMLVNAEDEFGMSDTEEEFYDFETEPDFSDEFEEAEDEPGLHDHEIIDFEEPEDADEIEDGEAEFEEEPESEFEFEEGETDTDIYEETADTELETWEDEFAYPVEDENTQAPGTTRFLAVSALPGQKYNTGAYLPPSFRPSVNVDVVLYFHGLYDPNNIERYWTEYTPLRQLFASSNKNALLLAPMLGKDPQYRKTNAANLIFFSSGGLDKFLDNCFAELIAAGQLPAGAKPARIIAAAHSAGGSPLSGILSGASQSLKKITEVWGFDCTYGYDYTKWLAANRHLKFYHYWATKKPKGFADDLQKAHPNFFNIAPKKPVNHQTMIAYAWENEVNKRTWFTTGTATNVPSRSTSDQTGMTVNMIAGIPFLPESSALDIAYSNGIRDKNQLTNLVFYKRFPAYRGRKLAASDPQNIKSAWSGILKTVVTPFLQQRTNVQPAPAPNPVPQAPVTPPPSSGVPVITDSQFVLQSVPLMNSAITITIKDGNRKAKLTEKPAVFLKAIVQKAGLDQHKFFNSMTDIKFLGRSFNSGELVHVEFAKLLKKIEAEFARKAGGVKDMKALGDQLGLENRTLAASRKASSTADLSWHMFGMALDISYTYNPFIQRPDLMNKLMVKIGYLVTGTKITEIPLNYRSWAVTKNTAGYLAFYDQLTVYNKYFKEYFSYIDDPATLSLKLAAAGDSWKGKSQAEALKIISHDLSELANGWMASREKPQQILKEHGFFRFSREFIQGMVEAGVDWGAWYGDMMHFDMRRTAIGGKITQGKTLYQREKLDEMGV